MSNLEEDYRRTVSGEVQSLFLPGTSIEIIREAPPGTRFRHVLFDFDGTLSLIREGWPEVMVPMMMEEILATGAREAPEAIYRHCHDFAMRLNGRQTIYQMIQLAAEIRARGGEPKDPLWYKQKYHERLMDKIGARRCAQGEPGRRTSWCPARWTCWRRFGMRGCPCISPAAQTSST